MWDLTEKAEMEKMLFSSRSPLRSALEKFLLNRAEQRNADCAQAMRSDPPEFHRASQYAAKAELYEELLADLERECDKDSSGPTG